MYQDYVNILIEYVLPRINEFSYLKKREVDYLYCRALCIAEGDHRKKLERIYAKYFDVVIKRKLFFLMNDLVNKVYLKLFL